MQDKEAPVTEEDWERIERYSGFELTQDCDCCGHENQCQFFQHYQYCLIFTVYHTMLSKKYGPEHKYKTIGHLRNKLYRKLATSIHGVTCKGKRIPLPNCVTSGVRGMLYGDGDFKGFVRQENVNPNGAL